MDNDVEAIRRVLLGAIEEKKREQQKTRMTATVSLIGGLDSDRPVYINAAQHMTIMQLLMEFYRIVHRDQPSIPVSAVCKRFLKKFKINSLEFLTVERFDEIVFDLLDAIKSYGDSHFDGDPNDFLCFQVNEDRDMSYATMMLPKAPKNIVTYLIGKIK